MQGLRMSMKSLLTLLLLLTTATPALANKVFVTNEKGNDITVIDGATMEVLGSYPAGTRPRGITSSGRPTSVWP